jgi:hypothetical protein
MTIPYVTGTVSVTAGSAVVTGSGTAWATALVAGGLFGLDSNNGNPVPILSVDSNTQLTLAKPWRGTTASGQGYWIVRDTAYLQQQTVNAQALSTYIQRLDNAALAALAGLTPAAGKLAYFSGPSAAVLTDLEAKGRDIIAATNTLHLLGKLGPVLGGGAPTPAAAGVGLADGDFNTVAVGGVYNITGTWANGPNGNGGYAGFLTVLQRGGTQAWQIYRVATTTRDEAYIRFTNDLASNNWPFPWRRLAGEVVGTVLQSGGVATGAIIERGSNANGQYTKFADGTMICGGGRDLTSSDLPSAGNYNLVIPFPATFSIAEGTPRLIASLGFQSDGAVSWLNLTKYAVGRFPSATSGNILMQTTGSFTTTVQAMWTAFGRWF